MTHLCGLLLSAMLASYQVSVAQCEADPTGQKDSTSAFVKCLDKLPAGDVIVPYGRYRITGTIVLNRNQNLIGMGSKASVLKCESTKSPCIVAADVDGGINNYSVSHIENLGIEGPGSSNTSIGIYLGGDPAGVINAKNSFADSVNLVAVRVLGFNHGCNGATTRTSTKSSAA